MRYRAMVLIGVLKILMVLTWFLGVPVFTRADAATKAAEPRAAKEAAVKDGGKQEEPKAASGGKEAARPADCADGSKELVAAVARRQKELDAREEAARAAEERLKAVKADIEARIAELNKMHGRLDGLVKKIDEADSERSRRLVKIYESMAPEEVSSRMEKLDDATAVQILSSMNEKKAAKILGLLSVERSVKLTKSLKLKDNS